MADGGAGVAGIVQGSDAFLFMLLPAGADVPAAR